MVLTPMEDFIHFTPICEEMDELSLSLTERDRHHYSHMAANKVED